MLTVKLLSDTTRALTGMARGDLLVNLKEQPQNSRAGPKHGFVT